MPVTSWPKPPDGLQQTWAKGVSFNHGCSRTLRPKRPARVQRETLHVVCFAAQPVVNCYKHLGCQHNIHVTALGGLSVQQRSVSGSLVIVVRGTKVHLPLCQNGTAMRQIVRKFQQVSVLSSQASS